jgi:2-polyprenyl-3-methyl-5-hydroxy-6-metoxy-1,4-benzoquinol methylase
MKEIAKLYWDGLYADRMNDCSVRIFTGAIDVFTELKKHPKANTKFWLSQKIMEWGCGTGEMGRVINLILPNVEYTGVDISGSAVKHAKQHYGSPTINYSTIIPDSHFDAIFTSNTLEHFHHPYVMIDKLLSMCDYLFAGHAFTFTEESFVNYNVVDSFTFFSHTWVQGPNPLQLLIVLKNGNS